MSMDAWNHWLTLPSGSVEKIPDGLCPVWRGGWCATNTDATVEGCARALAQAEREAETAQARIKYLRGLMGRVLAAHAALDAMARSVGEEESQ